MEQMAAGNDHLFRLVGIQLEVIGGGPLLYSPQFFSSVTCLIEDRMMRNVSANLAILFCSWTGWRSDALTTYSAGPRPDPCIILALICATGERRPAKRVE